MSSNFQSAESLVFLLKSYSQDFAYAKRLCSTFNNHNKDNIKLVIVCEKEDIGIFSTLISANISLVSSEIFDKYLVKEPFANLSVGYANQEIIKLCFWEFRNIDYYFCIDSDLIFIKDFFISDFLYENNNMEFGFTFFSPERELLSDPTYYKQFGAEREQHLKSIKNLIGLKSDYLWTTHGFSVFSANFLKSFKKEFLNKFNLDYSDLISISPYEFSWYNYWIQYRYDSQLRLKESPIKTIHSAQDLLSLHVRGVSMTDLSRQYIGVVVNSNFSKNLYLYDYEVSIEKVLSYNYSFYNLTLSILHRLILKLKQVFNFIKTKRDK